MRGARAGVMGAAPSSTRSSSMHSTPNCSAAAGMDYGSSNRMLRRILPGCGGLLRTQSTLARSSSGASAWIHSPISLASSGGSRPHGNHTRCLRGSGRPCASSRTPQLRSGLCGRRPADGADTSHAQILWRRARSRSLSRWSHRGVPGWKPSAVTASESLRGAVTEREDPHAPSVAAFRKRKRSGGMSGFDHGGVAEAVQLDGGVHSSCCACRAADLRPLVTPNVSSRSPNFDVASRLGAAVECESLRDALGLTPLPIG